MYQVTKQPSDLTGISQLAYVVNINTYDIEISKSGQR
jgi:hypothetical protein